MTCPLEHIEINGIRVDLVSCPMELKINGKTVNDHIELCFFFSFHHERKKNTKLSLIDDLN